MAEKRVIEYEAASELANDDWLLIDGVTEGTRKARPSTVTAELGAQVTNLASTVGGLTQVAMGHEQSFAPSYDEDTSYDVGDLVMQYHCLYRCTAATTGTWDAGKWARTEVSEQLEESGKIDDVQVNGVSVVTDKVASIDLTDMQDDIDSKQADTKIGGASILDENKVLNMDNFMTKASISNTPTDIATFNASALPMPSLTVGIEATQSGSGDPSPTNIRPISGWSAVNVYDTGVNTWDEEWEVGAYNTNDGTKANTNNQIRSKDYIEVIPNASYYWLIPYTSSISGFAVALYYDANKNYIHYQNMKSNGDILTMPSNCRYATFFLSALYGTTYNNDISINYPSTDTSYNAYSGTTYTTTLKDANDQPLTCYGGQLENVNGVQVLTADATENQKVKLSDLTWTYQSSNERFYCDTPITVKRPSSNTELPVYFGCECYKAVPYSSYTNGNITITSSGSMFVKDSNYTDTTTWLNAVGNNNILLPLATPQQIPQQSQAISTQDGINNLWADSGKVISGEYYSKYETSNVYSTDEKAVGVDASGKTRYQKTYLNLGNVTSYTFSDLTNVSTMFVVSEGSKLNGGLPFPYIHPDSDNVVGYFFDLSGTNPKIEIRKGSGSSSATLDMLTIQYTK